MNIMLSGGKRKINKQVYDFIDNHVTIAYIPSWYSLGSFSDYKKFKKQFKKAKVKYYPLDRLNKKAKKELFESDVIYIDGGNTYVLLDLILKNNLVNDFKKYEKEKILIGLSAGSIIQTKNINMANIPLHTADDNFLNLKKKNSLSIVGFEVHPHFDKSDKKEVKELKDYSLKNNKEIILIPDGSSLICSRSKIIKIIGPAWSLVCGNLVKISK